MTKIHLNRKGSDKLSVCGINTHGYWSTNDRSSVTCKSCLRRKTIDELWDELDG